MATSPIYSWPEPDNTDLVKNGALAIRTLGDAIDTTMGTMVAKTIVDAKADLIVGTAADTVSRLAVGSNGQVLTADSTVSPTGLKWATASSGGKVLQVVSATYSTQTTSTSTTFATTNLTATITPTLATSKIAVFATIDGCQNGAGISGMAIKFRLMRGGTQLSIFNEYSFTRSNLEFIGNYAHTFTDSPATTSATTYTMEFASAIATYTARVNTSGGSSNLILMEIGV